MIKRLRMCVDDLDFVLCVSVMAWHGSEFQFFFHLFSTLAHTGKNPAIGILNVRFRAMQTKLCFCFGIFFRVRCTELCCFEILLYDPPKIITKTQLRSMETTTIKITAM